MYARVEFLISRMNFFAPPLCVVINRKILLVECFHIVFFSNFPKKFGTYYFLY